MFKTSIEYKPLKSSVKGECCEYLVQQKTQINLYCRNQSNLKRRVLTVVYERILLKLFSHTIRSNNMTKLELSNESILQELNIEHRVLTAIYELTLKFFSSRIMRSDSMTKPAIQRKTAWQVEDETTRNE